MPRATILSSILSSSLALLLGATSLYYGTSGGLAWTSESARRLKVKENPIQLPNLVLTDQDGNAINYKYSKSPSSNIFGEHNDRFKRKNLVNNPSLVLMEFIFTRCPTVCLAMGAEFSQLQSSLSLIDDLNVIKLLSVSFDERDSENDLNNYLSRFAADKKRWSSAKFNDRKQLKSVMHSLGAIAIPEPNFGFVHNSAVYVVKQNRVIAIVDHTDQKRLLQIVNRELLSKQRQDNAH